MDLHISLIVVALIVAIGVIATKLSSRSGVPTLLLFLAAGIAISFALDTGVFSFIGLGTFSNAPLVSDISMISIAVIIFYGGFNTNFNTAKPVLTEALILSGPGTVLTAFGIGFIAHLVFNLSFLYSMLLGAVIASTDAAALFNILRSRNINFKHGLAPMLEVESGSNDPFALVLTMTFIKIIAAGYTTIPFGEATLNILLQVVVAGVIGLAFKYATIWIFRNIRLDTEGLDPILLLALVLLAFGLAEWLNASILPANGLLALYIFGISLGNSQFVNKLSQIHFFDSVSWVLQVVLFFMLGLLANFSNLMDVALYGTLIFVATLIVRLLVVSVILFFINIGKKAYTKKNIKEQFIKKLLVSWVGLRGAASIVFSIVAIVSLPNLPFDLFHIVFFVTLFSIGLQGSLTPWVAKKLDLIDSNPANSVYKTFADYEEYNTLKMYECTIPETSPVVGEMIKDIGIPAEYLVIMVKRKIKKEQKISSSKWIGDKQEEVIKNVYELKAFIPQADTELLAEDVLVVGTAKGDSDFHFFKNLERSVSTDINH